ESGCHCINIDECLLGSCLWLISFGLNNYRFATSFHLVIKAIFSNIKIKTMHFIQQSFHVDFEYKIQFTEDLFNKENAIFRKLLQVENPAGIKRKLLFVADAKVLQHFPNLWQSIIQYFEGNEYVNCIKEII